MSGARLLILTAMGLAVATPAHAFDDPDWPCESRKVRNLSWGQMWAGPPLPESSRAWRDDEAVNRLVSLLAARRTSMQEAETLVADLGPGEDRSRDERLIALFAGAFDRIDDDRAEIVDGIVRLARRERSRSERIEEMRAEIDALRAEAGPEDYDTLDRIEEMEDNLAWETRTYEDRRRSLQYVCETPVILEKRAFALARLIQGELEGG